MQNLYNGGSMTKRKIRSKPNRKNRNPRPLTVSLAADVHQFIDDSIERSEYDLTRSRMVEDCIRFAQALATADEILGALQQLHDDHADTEHLDRCRALVGLAKSLIDETKSPMLIMITVSLDAEIQKIDHAWLRSAVDGAAAAKKEPAQ